MEGYKWIATNENRLNVTLPQPYDLIRGSIIGMVDMVDCVKCHGSRWFFGPFGFVFEHPVIFKEPIPYRGQPKIFEAFIHPPKL